MKKIYLLTLIVFLSIFKGNSIGVLILIDQGTECTRTRLADFFRPQISSVELASYFTVYSDTIDSIGVAYKDIYGQCRSSLSYPLVVANPSQIYSTYLFLEYEREGWLDGNHNVSKILKVEIFAEPPYKYKVIEYLEIDREDSIKNLADDFINNHVEKMVPPPPLSSIYDSTRIEDHCFNYPRLFELVDVDIADIGKKGNGDIKMEYRYNPEIPDSIKLNWINIQNEIDVPVTVFISDDNRFSLEELSRIDNLAIRYIWTNQNAIEALGLSNVDDIFIIYLGGENMIRLPYILENAKQLTTLQISGLNSVGTLEIPESVLTLPNLTTLEIGKNLLFRKQEFYLTISKYFEMTRLDKRGCVFERNER